MKEHETKHKQGPRSTKGQHGTRKKPLPQRARDPKHAKNETGRKPGTRKNPERTLKSKATRSHRKRGKPKDGYEPHLGQKDAPESPGKAKKKGIK